MKRYLLGASLLSILSGLAAGAEEKIEWIFPSRAFNAVEARRALEPGRATLRGVIQKKIEKPNDTYPGIVVTLYPDTAYFQEFQELRRQHKDGKQRVTMSPEAASYCILAKSSDQDGSFVFPQLKPGKYHLEAQVQVSAVKIKKTQVGTDRIYSTWGFGSVQALQSTDVPIYEDYAYRYTEQNRVEASTEIVTDGQVVDVKL